MRLFLAGLSSLALVTLAVGQPTPPHYNLTTMTPAEVDRAATGHPRFDFDLAPEDGVIDASGKLIRASELPEFLRTQAPAADTFIFLWIRPDSAPLSTIGATVKPFGDYGLTRIVVRHRPEAVANNRTTGDARFAAVRTELLEILKTDQQYREQLDALQRAGNATSPERPGLVQKIRETDAVNLPKVEAILAEHGWLGPDDVGKEASGALFLVIQHSNTATQKKYLPMMRAAVKAGKARGSSLALLEDRIALAEGNPQIYGSQLRSEGNGPLFVQAMEDPDHVDERRASVGLGPMAEYVKHWNLTWDLEAYKKQLPSLLTKLARQNAAAREASKPDQP
jgi:hypothetical protein